MTGHASFDFNRYLIFSIYRMLLLALRKVRIVKITPWIPINLLKNSLPGKISHHGPIPLGRRGFTISS